MILVVDDDAYIRGILRRQLQASGYRVGEVESGDRALELIRTLRPDLVLLDVVMPGMNGLETCARLKADPAIADTPVLFLSSAADIPTKAAGFELGCQDYMTKPVDLRELQLRVKAAMSTKIAREALLDAANRLERERQRLKLQAMVDPLTGLTNRRGLCEEGSRSIDEARYHGKALSLWMVDVDHFKRVNDTWGHAVGDEVLKGLAAQMRSKLRDRGLCARFGGEEFSVILPGTDLAHSVLAAEDIRRSVEALRFQVGSESFHVTVSIGASSFPEDGSTLDDLMELADQRLYVAKRSGRNQVVSGHTTPNTNPHWSLI